MKLSVVRGVAVAALWISCGGSTLLAQSPSTLVQWNFNNSTTSPSTLDPNFLTAPTITTINTTGGYQFVPAAHDNSSDPNTPNNALQTSGFPNQGTGNLSAGYQFNFNTTNYTLSTFQYDFIPSGTGSAWAQMQYTTDGKSWQQIVLPTPEGSTNDPTTGGIIVNGDIMFTNNSWANASSSVFNMPIDLTALNNPAINNDPNFGIRMVAVYAPISFTDSAGTHAANTAYENTNLDPTSNYKTSGNWRIDMVTLNGTYNPPAFVPANLTWNAGSGTWDSNSGNQPWLNGAVASPFHQNGGQGDNVTFNNPTSGSVITVGANGVTPNSTTINNLTGTLTFTGGSIGGTGGITKTGGGTLVIDNSNTFTGAANSSSISGGILETHKTSPLGTGPVSLNNVTWNATTNNQTSAGTVTLNGAVTINTSSNLNLSGGLAGAGTLLKQGSGTLEVGGNGTNTGNITVTGGTLQLDSMNATGGNPALGVSAPTMSVSNNASVVFNGTGKSSTGGDTIETNNVTLNNATVSRAVLNGGNLGTSTTSGDSIMSAYDTAGDYNGAFLTVKGTTSFVNNETRTANAGDASNPGSGGPSNQLGISMPVLVTSGSTLIANAVNGTLSNAGSGPAGSLKNTAVEFHGTAGLSNSNDSITLQAGATLQLTGAGEKRIGTNDTGKAIVGMGTASGESTFKADGVTFMTDLAGVYSDTNKVNSLFVVAGTGLNGLRIEAPLNATYTSNGQPNLTNGQIATSGLFGNNPDTTASTAGNVYTIMSPNRYAGLSGYDGMPTTAADGSALPALGGTLTLAATDSGTGLVDNGPAVGTAVKIGFDNTTTSGALTYNVDASANGGAFSNFGGLVIHQSNAAQPVTVQLLNNTTINGAASGTTYDQSGGTFNLNGHTFTVSGAANITGGHILGASSSFTASSINFTGGGISPEANGTTPGTLNLFGNTAFGHSTVSNFELGTPNTVGGGINSLAEITGNLTLAGAIDITGLAGFGAGVYRLFDYTGSLTNNLPTIGALPAGYGAAFDFSTPHQVNLDVVKYGSIPGDVNGDGIVNIADLTMVGSNWLSSGNFLIGDANHDNIVNIADLTLIGSNWLQQGGGTGTDIVFVNGTSVPEPGTWALCVIGAVVSLGWRTARRVRGA